MKIGNHEPSAEVSGVQASTFGFDMNAKMYDILIAKMYTNKPGAVIRELSSNAWDSHEEAGKADKPFELHLPTWLEKTFAIRDYGSGIPHDKFEQIYTNVGVSTKEDSNDLIGGFGLGSKTPFTMTDTFMVENWNNGIKTTWVCFKSAGIPQVSKVSEESSDEPSGLKVSFSFDDGDVPEFTKQVVRQLTFFPVKPVITGGEGKINFPELPKDWDTKDYFYGGVDTYGSSANYVIMGNVAYSVDPYEFDYSLRDLFRRGLCLKVPIGSVDIPPSREHLEMTPKTKQTIVGILNRIKAEYVKDVQDSLDKCNTEWEVRKLVHDLNGSLISNPKELTWKGEEIAWHSYRRSYIESIAGYRIKGINRGYIRPYRATELFMSRIKQGNYKLYVNDLGQGGSKHINETYTKHSVDLMYILDVSSTPKATFDARVKEAVKKVTKETGSAPLLLSSVFGMPPVPTKAAKGTNQAGPNQVFRVGKYYDRYSSMQKQLIAEDTLPKDGYYVELKGWAVETKLPYSLSSALEKGLVGFLDKPLYFIRSKTIPKLHKSMTLLTSSITDGLKDTMIEQYKKARDVSALTNLVHRMTNKHLMLLPHLKDKDLKVYARYSNWLYSIDTTHLARTDTLYQLLYKDTLKYTPKVNPRLPKMAEKFKPIDKVTTLVCRSYSSEINKENMQYLINLINQNQ